MRNIPGVLLTISAVLALFFVAVVGISFSQSGAESLLHPRIFLATIGTAFQGVFGVREKTLMEIPEKTENGGVPTTEPCTYETFTKKKLTGVVFNEIAWMGTKENYNAEWMELKNISENPVDISLWQLLDTDERIRIIFPKGTVIQPGKFFVLAREVKTGGIKGDSTYTGTLRNTGTGLRIFNSGCELEDEVLRGKWPAGDNKTKQTMIRTESGVWKTSSEIGGTPERENNGGVVSRSQSPETKNPTTKTKIIEIVANNSSPVLPVPTTSENKEKKPLARVFLSEVSPGSDRSADDEFIELYNPNDFSVLLSGWSIKKKTASGKISSLVSESRFEGKSILANGYFLIGRESGYQGNVLPDAVWAKSNVLAYENNTLLLFNDTGNQVDMMGWTEIPKGKSLLRSISGNEVHVGDRSPKAANGF